MPIKVRSAKSKGMGGQKEIRDILLQEAAPYGIVEDDIRSTSSGSGGVDILLSPAAQKLFPWSIEVKRVEKLNVATVFEEHHARYAKHKDRVSVLFHRRNKNQWLVTLRLTDFMNFVRKNFPK